MTYVYIFCLHTHKIISITGHVRSSRLHRIKVGDLFLDTVNNSLLDNRLEYALQDLRS